MIYEKDSMVISTAAYALGEITKDDFCENDLTKLINFDDIDNSLIRESLNYGKVINEGQIQLDLEIINRIIDFLVASLKIKSKYLIDRSEICVRRVIASKKKKPEENKAKESEENDNETKVDEANNVENTSSSLSAPSLEMFNSFFLKPLNSLRKNVENITKDSAISKYLGLESKPNSIDILEDLEAFKHLLQPKEMQLSRWPSSPKNTLAALQAAAINSILPSSEKLFAINGPPGTGKTTLMFDIIANLYVERALKMSQLKHPEDGFDKQNHVHEQQNSNKKPFKHNIKTLKTELQNYSIVIASSNNNSVENISKELPLNAKIDPLYQNELDFFSQLLADKNSWGIFSAVLGNSKNRRKFIERFWDIRNEKDNNKSKTFTMRQYLNLLNNNNHKDHAPANYKPKYCNSTSQLEAKWFQECQEFKELHKKITDIYDAIDIVIIHNKVKKDILSKNKIIIDDENLTNAITKLNVILRNIDQELEKITRNFKGFKFELSEKIHKFFNTRKYQYFIERENKLKDSREIIELQDVLHILVKPTMLLKEYGFDVKNFEDDHFWQIWEEQSNRLHKTTPYFNEKFEQLRSELFIKATKIHEVFINANADIFWCSLNLFATILTTSSMDIDRKIWQTVWQNFFMVVPVVSTTFHSFDNMFKYFDHNNISWLIIDEAGQAQPQYAASAIYKSKNVVVVGDPMQTQPVSTLKQKLIEKLCEKFSVSFPAWSPSKVSVQHLADRNSLYQTKYGKTLVGFPLLVHRRCQNPMFDICNKIAYDDKMIFAASPPKSVITDILGGSRWINVADNNSKKAKHESKAEFDVLYQLLKSILNKPNSKELLEQIYVITMYKSFKLYIQKNIKDKISNLTKDKKLPKHIKDFCDRNIGTIHAFQGKEADTVIMLLGAQRPGDVGTRIIMTDKPNVLNVGISRAKNNLYIIGNAEIWLKHKYMKEIYNMLGDQT